MKMYMMYNLKAATTLKLLIFITLLSAAFSQQFNGPSQILWFAVVKSTDCDERSPDYQMLYSKALVSAQSVANSHDAVLHPVLIWWGTRSLFPDQLRKEFPDIIVVQHKLSFVDQLPAWQQQACDSGAYLRLDIPTIIDSNVEIQAKVHKSNGSISKEHFLYTDSDVLFLRPVDWTRDIQPVLPDFHSSRNPHGPIISYGASGTDYPSPTTHPYNTGVMFVNIAGFKTLIPSLLKYGAARNFTIVRGSFDQALMNSFAATYKSKLRRKLLDTFWHWRVYWPGPEHIGTKRARGSISRSPVLIHFHGPKPNKGLECLAQEGVDIQKVPLYDVNAPASAALDYSPEPTNLSKKCIIPTAYAPYVNALISRTKKGDTFGINMVRRWCSTQVSSSLNHVIYYYVRGGE